MPLIPKKKLHQSKILTKTMGLKELASLVDQDTFQYILRCLYHIVFKSNGLKESKKQLRRRIRLFEKQCALPHYLSSMPIPQFIAELEDAQYFYPIRAWEVSLPDFN